MVSVPDDQTRRRLLKAFVGGAAAVGGVAAGVRLGVLPGGTDEGDDSFSGAPQLQLSAEDASGVAALEVVLGDDLLPKAGPGLWRSPQLRATTHSMVGFVWTRGSAEPSIRISSRRRGQWSSWQKMPLLHDAPDPDADEDIGKAGTDVVWIGAANGIQVRVDGHRPRDLTLVLLHPGRLPGDTQRSRLSPRATTATASRDGFAPRPTILNRKAWGANESWRDKPPRYCPTIEQVHVHHTVNSNDYTRDDVPALLRGIYRYHTHSLGWSDIAYNFLVDRFGRAWVGRAGGAAKAVRGGHTLGFNATSTGISVIGNYETASPDAATLSAIAAIAAWKLDRYARDPLGEIAVRSEGSDKFKSGQVVTLPVLDGHRDTNDTACPGRNLYAALPTVRQLARSIIDESRQKVEITSPFTLAGTGAVGQTMSVLPGTFDPPDATVSYTWLRDGAAIPGATGSSYQIVADDAGRALGVQVLLQRAEYRSASQSLVAADPVMSRAVLDVRPVAKGNKVVVKVRVSAEGVPYPRGEVRIDVDGRRRIVKLDDGGKARVIFTGFAPGKYPVKVKHLGNWVLLPGRWEGKVRVRRTGAAAG